MLAIAGFLCCVVLLCGICSFDEYLPAPSVRTLAYPVVDSEADTILLFPVVR